MKNPGLRSTLYWALAWSLIAVGVPAIFSIGAPFLALGVTLVILAPRRGNPRAFWPPVVGVAMFFVAYVLVAPLGCTTTAGAVSRTTCSNILGIDYSGAGGYNPPLWPAAAAAGVAAALGTAATRRLLRAR